MRAVVLLTTIFMALAAAAPEKTMEKLRERELCFCDERSCDGPPCCANGTC
ncbi:hypothetical protein N656DRAFT_847908 [Canariomyces notabilis]|uniref:Uncharacterized protein n=1 Tax=Canariomyces notabilis TaxID=2074819 RepID=A0AAN6QFG8_9PEZI|nr:hypothetical protein N656DRAFT_847908 [Canariomyces arenarius]